MARAVLPPVGKVIGIEAWRCGSGSDGCKASNSPHGCVHLSALLQALQNLERPEVAGGGDIPTARLCKWNSPGAGPAASCETPASQIRIMKPRRMLGRVRDRIVLDEAIHRDLFNPYSRESDELDEADVSAPARCLARAALFRALRAATGQNRPCAAEVQWQHDSAASEAPAR